MNISDLLDLFRQNIPELSERQRRECLDALEGAPKDETGALPSVVVEAQPDCCPHCSHDKLGKWGYASGLRRWSCKNCSRTFNILTKTPLARLRKKEKWSDNAKAMIAGKSVRDTAKDCDVQPNTAFLWRHRFLECQRSAQHANLKGIAESDVTYFYRSEKGKKNSIEHLEKGAEMASVPD